MYRPLSLLAALLLTMAQVPAPGGDFSNGTTKATGSTTARKLADRAADGINPLDFGATADGTLHYLNSVYSTLAAAQAYCPKALDITTYTFDWCALQLALDKIAARPAIVGVKGSPGGTIRIGDNQALRPGTHPLVLNNASLTLEGASRQTSVIFVGTNPAFQFGLQNHLSVGTMTKATGGQSFSLGDTINPTVPGCASAPVLTVKTINDDSVGDISTFTISNNGGSGCTAPTNPMAYTTSGQGVNLQVNGTVTGGVLSAVSIYSTGTGCNVNDVVATTGGYGSGGMTPTGTPIRQATARVASTDGSGGATGFFVTDGGDFGQPPRNPVSTTTVSGTCSGAGVNIGAFGNSGYTLDMRRFHLVADGTGVAFLDAQFNVNYRSDQTEDIVLDAVSPNYWDHFVHKYSSTNSITRNIEAINNLAFINTNPSGPVISVSSQNNMFGHYGDEYDYVNAYSFTGGAILYQLNDSAPFQGQMFDRDDCGLSLHCIQLLSTTAAGYGDIVLSRFYAGQSVDQFVVQNGLNLWINTSAFAQGQTRLTSLPASSSLISLTNVNQFIVDGIACNQALTVIPTEVCVDLQGTSGNGIVRNSLFLNGAKTASVTGVQFGLNAGGNGERGDLFGANVVPVNDLRGVFNDTESINRGCLSKGLANGETWTIPDSVNCVYFTNGLISGATVIMPAHAGTNQDVSFTAFGTTTTLTLQANTGQVMGGGMPTTIAGGTPFRVRFLSGRWQRMN